MLIIGHRGAKGLAPENTLAALQAGLNTRVSMLEIDVRVTRDDTAVLFHDPFIRDSNGAKRFIHEIDFLELQSIKPDLLTLEAALQFIDRRTDIVIEIKPGIAIEPVMACIQPRIERNWLESDFIISSFDFKLLSRVHRDFPTVHLAVLDKWSSVRAGMRARKLHTKRITMNQRWLWSGFIRSVSGSGYKLSAYTLNNPKKAKKWEKAGLYAVITDYPDRFV